MKTNKLTNDEQILILMEAKDIYSERAGNTGMCGCIRSALLNHGHGHWSTGVVEYIPTFTRDHIVELTEGTLLSPYRRYWFWDVADREIRPKVFDLLINELK